MARAAREANAAYASATARLLALSRGGNRGDAASFALTTQTPVYERYPAALAALLRFAQAGGLNETSTMHVPIGVSGVQAVPNTLHSHGLITPFNTSPH